MSPTILIALASVFAVVLIILVVVTLQPSEFRVARTAKIEAPAPVVFAQVNDFRNWEAWNPWGKIDSAMKQTYEGPSAGTGAIYSWVGNKNVGEGRMTITQSRPSELIGIKLEFIKPFANVCDAEFTFKPEGNQTSVTWCMTGKKNIMAKAFHLCVNMDKMIGGQFEKGLADMRSAAQAAAAS